VIPEVWKSYLTEARNTREADKLNRKLRTMRRLSATRIQVGSRDFVNFAGNDYLGLSGDMRIAETAAAAAGRYGWGSGASRLVTGSSALHAKLETETAAFRGAGAALVFGSGFQANLGVISALAGKGDTVLSDVGNHASIIAGCRLSGAETVVFNHRDYEDLEEKLQAVKAGRKLVVTDSLFSITGAAANLERILELCKRHDALLVVDDAHANACLGENGRGIPEIQNVLEQVPVVVGTYSKALGSYGGFVACDALVREHLVNNSRAFIYTTALPPALAAANTEALRIVRKEGGQLRAALADNTEKLRARLAAAEFEPTGKHHILALHLRTPERALFYAEQLEQVGIIAYPMRWPSVAKGDDALRVSVTAAHTEDDLNRLVAALRTARDRASGKETGYVVRRSARRPVHQSLEASEPADQPQPASLDDMEVDHPEFDDAFSATDSTRIYKADALAATEGGDSGGTVIIKPQTAEAEQSEADWAEVEPPAKDPPPKSGKSTRRSRRRERIKQKNRSRN
jgi:8-amino-7-oxononanoate synthase